MFGSTNAFYSAPRTYLVCVFKAFHWFPLFVSLHILIIAHLLFSSQNPWPEGPRPILQHFTASNSIGKRLENRFSKFGKIWKKQGWNFSKFSEGWLTGVAHSKSGKILALTGVSFSKFCCCKFYNTHVQKVYKLQNRKFFLQILKHNPLLKNAILQNIKMEISTHFQIHLFNRGNFQVFPIFT